MKRSLPHAGLSSQTAGPYILLVGEPGAVTRLGRMLKGAYRFDSCDALEAVGEGAYDLVVSAGYGPEVVDGTGLHSIVLTHGCRGTGGRDAVPLEHECLDAPFSRARLIRAVEGAWQGRRAEKVRQAAVRLRLRLKEEVRGRKERAHLLKMNEHALFHSINGLFFADANGDLVAANPAFLHLWGYEHEGEVLGVGMDHFFAMDSGVGSLRRQLESMGGLHREMMAVRKEGAHFPVQASITLFGPDRQLSQGCMGVFIDLTEKNRNEEFKLQSLKLLALGHLSAGLAHELRNPLAVISSCAQFSIENLTLERPLAENLQVIYRNSQKASRLIEELLSFAKPSNLDWKHVDINGLLRHVLQMAKLEAKRGTIRAEVEADPLLPQIIGDQEKLEQVFLNITLNAFQAVSKSGRVTLKTRFVTSKGMVEVNVIDNGPGIPEEYRQQVFDPFFTTKDNGTGLGLSISHAIVKQHGGQIRINCERENETNISVLLPLESRERAS